MKSASIGLFVGLFIGAIIVMIAGESPWNVLKIFYQSSFGSKYDFGMTLFYTTPLIFTGLSVSFAFQAGLFNIGAEGQLNIAALAATVVGIIFPSIPFPFAPILAVAAAISAGFLYGFIPGWLNAKRGSHEVINTIMLNFIASALTSWMALKYWQNPNSQNPETMEIGKNYFFRSIDPIAKYFGDAPASSAFFIAVLVAFCVWILLKKTVFGYQVRVVGENETAASFAGINVPKIKILALSIAGALAGMVALGEVLGGVGKFRVGFSADYGFIGIAVALLARNHPIGIIASSFLFAFLHKGASNLDLETEHITRDLSVILQALVILTVCIKKWRRT